MAKMSSPGIYVNESDLSQYSAVMDPSKIIAVVGGAQNGPINTVVPVRSKKEFETMFGNPIDIGGLTAVNILKYSSSLLYVRASSDSAKARQVSFYGVSDGNAVADALVIKHKYPGTLFRDKLTARINSVPGSSEDQFRLVIEKGDGEVLLDKVYSCKVDSPIFIGKDTSTDFIFTTDESDLDSIDANEGEQFSDGNNGFPISGDDYEAAVEKLSDSETIDVDIIGMPGVIDGTAISALVDVAMSRKDCVPIIDHPQGLTPEEVAQFYEGQNGDYPIPKIDTSYAAAYSPWGKVFNEYTGESQWAPPSAGVLPAMAAEYASYDPWTAPAGVPRFVLSVFSELERSLDQDDRDILYSANVNPLCNYKNLGLTALGQKTLQRTKSAVDRLNVRFLINYIKKMAEFKSVNYLFMNIDDNTFGSWIQDISKDLDNVKNRGGIYDYRVKMDWETVSSEMLNNNIMPGVIQVKPTKTAEFIPIDVVIRNRDDEF